MGLRSLPADVRAHLRRRRRRAVRDRHDRPAEGRADEILYPVNEVAAKYDASVLEETTSPNEAYARFERGKLTRYREGWLP